MNMHERAADEYLTIARLAVRGRPALWALLHTRAWERLVASVHTARS